jgi:hypothetical protein
MEPRLNVSKRFFNGSGHPAFAVHNAVIPKHTVSKRVNCINASSVVIKPH